MDVKLTKTIYKDGSSSIKSETPSVTIHPQRQAPIAKIEDLGVHSFEQAEKIIDAHVSHARIKRGVENETKDKT